MPQTLFDKVWDAHVVAEVPGGNQVLYIDRHLIHEVTSPQAFNGLRNRNLPIYDNRRIVATADHNVPTKNQDKPIQEPLSRKQVQMLTANCAEFGVDLYGLGHPYQGIVHVIGPELGITRPGITMVCGDSHTSTHGAFGTIAMGIGTSQVAAVLATQTLALGRPKVRRVEINGELQRGVYAKDVTLYVIQQLGVKGGIGYAYEYAGDTIDRMSMEERMTVCNMSIEGGARCGYINPDQTTVDYLRGRPHAPQGDAFDQAADWWLSLASQPHAEYDDEVRFDAARIEPTVTWGITPGQSCGVSDRVPRISDYPAEDQTLVGEALEYMGLDEGQPIAGTKIDVAFIGSCTNGRISDLREAAEIARGHRVADGVKALVVPGSQQVAAQAEAEGLPEIFTAAGFEWRGAGCSMCLAMNPDKLQGREVCASSSNRNFKGRQGSPTGRTLLMSPAMVTAAAIRGEVTDVREMIDAPVGV